MYRVVVLMSVVIAMAGCGTKSDVGKPADDSQGSDASGKSKSGASQNGSSHVGQSDGGKDADAKPPADPDLERMQGNWRVVAATEDGNAVSEQQTVLGRFKVEGAEFTFVPPDPNERPEIMPFQLDSKANPKQITFARGDRESPGIYEFKNGRWSIAIAMGDRERPKDFSPAADVVTYVLEPVKRPAADNSKRAGEKAGGQER